MLPPAELHPLKRTAGAESSVPRSALLCLEIPVLPGSANKSSRMCTGRECTGRGYTGRRCAHAGRGTTGIQRTGTVCAGVALHRYSADGSSPQWAELQPLEFLTLARLHLQLAHSQPVLECSPALELVPRLSQPHHLQTLSVSAPQPPASPTLYFQMIPKPDDLSGESCSSR